MSLLPRFDRRWTLIPTLLTATLIALAGAAGPSAAADATATPAATTHPVPGPPTWPTDPQPIPAAPAAEATPDDGVALTTIGLGIAGSALAVGGMVAFTGRRHRRVQRVRATP